MAHPEERHPEERHPEERHPEERHPFFSGGKPLTREGLDRLIDRAGEFGYTPDQPEFWKAIPPPGWESGGAVQWRGIFWQIDELAYYLPEEPAPEIHIWEGEGGAL